ncbi:MAG: peptidoglycan-binding protein [Gaiellaceae bacterium]
MRRFLLLVAIAALATLGDTSVASAASARVAALQVALRHAHLYSGPIDGIRGPLTHRATVALQRRARITVDGVAGRQTRRALGRYGRPALGRRVVGLGMVGWDVSELQFLLRLRGLSNAPVTGRFGRQTDALLRGFQHAHRLRQDGLAGPHTLRALRDLRERHRVRVVRDVSVRTSIDSWARRYGVDAELAKALAWMESGFQTNLTSRTGAWGIFQVEPATWAYVEGVLLGHLVARSPDGNIRVGILYLRHLLREFGNRRLALAAWYEGPAAVRRHRFTPDTRTFVEDVIALAARM